MPLTTFSQTIKFPIEQPETFRLIVINDTTNFCFTAAQTKFFVKQTRQNQLNTDNVIDLQHANDLLLTRINGLMTQIEIMSRIDSAQNDLNDINTDRVELSEKERRRLKRRAFWSNVWNTGKIYIATGTSIVAGFGIGYGVASINN